MIAREDLDDRSFAAVKVNDAQNPSTYLQNNLARRSNSKKLSVVPEQDEQLTVTSISQILYPTPSRQTNFNNSNSKPTDGAQRLAAHFEAANDDMPEAVVVVDGTSNIVGPEPLGYEEPIEYNGQQPLRFHYSMPILST